MTNTALQHESCASCHKPFPRTGELASLPCARRIAFDPQENRVWRICTSCCYWTQVGTDTAAAVARELRQRLPHGDHPAIVHDVLGQLSVITSSTRDDALEPSRKGLRLRRLAPAGRWLLPLVVGAAVLMPQFLYLAMSSWHVDEVFWDGLLHGPLFVVAITQMIRWHAREKIQWWLVLPAIALFVAGSVIEMNSDPSRYHLVKAIVTACFAAGLLALVGTVIGHLGSTIQTEKRRSVLLSPRLAAVTTFGIDPVTDRAALFGLPDGDRCSSAKAIIGSGAFGGAGRFSGPRADVEAAWSILRRHGDFAGVLRALAVLRPEDNGRHRWQDVPRTWAIALQMAAAEAEGSTRERAKLRDRIREASAVAAIADELDRELGDSTP